MKKQHLINILLAILLIVPIPNFAEGISSSVFCEMSTSTCPVFDKDDPDFETQISNYTFNVLMASIGEPTIISATPFKVYQDSTIDLVIDGQNTNFDISSNVIIGDGIIVNEGGDVLSAEKMIVNITVSPNANTGFYNITVSSNDENATGENILQVVEASNEPEIVSITPVNIAKGSDSYKAFIYGLNTNFTQDSIIEFDDKGITARAGTIYSSNYMDFFITVDETARQGIHNIVVTTGDEIATNAQLGILRIVQEGSIQEIELPTEDPIEIDEPIETDSGTDEIDSGTDETDSGTDEIDGDAEETDNTVENTKLCPDSYEIHTYCTFDNKEVIDLFIAENAGASNITLVGNLINEGQASNINILEGAILVGGDVTGTIQNSGMMSNFTFVGASITGGVLQGDINNNSPIYGYFEDIYLAPDTIISGGQLRGDIFGVDPNNKPILQNLKIRKGSVLYNVKIGKDVIMDEDRVFIDESVEFIH